jgi:glycosyltransferase involved in cell wall biosynthesis
VERHLELLNGELGRRGYRVAVITERHDPALPAHETWGSEEVHRLSAERLWGIPGTGVLKFWGGLMRLWSLLSRADWIHCHDYEALLKWYLPFRLLMPRKPLTITFHGWEGQYPPRPAVVRARRVTAALARANLCIGGFIPVWYGTRADAISLGAVEPPLVYEEKTERAVFVGRLAPDTGLMTYLDGIDCLQRRYGIRLPLDVYGEGPLASRAEGVVRERNLEVSFHGVVEDAPARLGPARFAFVSGYLAILEAMIRRTPVFGVHEHPLKHDYLASLPPGLMAVAASPEELCEQLYRAVTQPEETTRMVDAAEDWARKQTPAALADTYEEIWRAAGT